MATESISRCSPTSVRAAVVETDQSAESATKTCRGLTGDECDRINLILDRVKAALGVAQVIVEYDWHVHQALILKLDREGVDIQELLRSEAHHEGRDGADLPALLSFTMSDVFDVKQLLNGEARHGG